MNKAIRQGILSRRQVAGPGDDGDTYRYNARIFELETRLKSLAGDEQRAAGDCTIPCAEA